MSIMSDGYQPQIDEERLKEYRRKLEMKSKLEYARKIVRQCEAYLTGYLKDYEIEISHNISRFPITVNIKIDVPKEVEE